MDKKKKIKLVVGLFVTSACLFIPGIWLLTEATNASELNPRSIIIGWSLIIPASLIIAIAWGIIISIALNGEKKKTPKEMSIEEVKLQF